MRNRITKKAKRALAMLLSIIMVASMVPLSAFAAASSTVTTDLPQEVFVGEYVEFNVTTTANDDLNKFVLGYLDFNNGDWSVLESLEYKENGQWYTLPQGVPFGPPATGFPMADASSAFRVKFKIPGTYTFSISMKTFDGDEELCAVSQQITASVKPSEITTDIESKAFVVGVPTEFTFTSIPNGHAGEFVFGKFTFSDWDAVESLQYWGVTENQWMPLPKDVLFGPPGTGFPMTQATTRLLVTFNKAGTFTCSVALVKQSDTSVVLSSVEATVTVTETTPPTVDTISGNPENWAQSAVITGTVSDNKGGSGVAKVVYSTEATYADTHTQAALSEGTFSFEVTENATYYVWAIDGNGNRSDAKSIVIDKIDTVAPELEAKADPEAWSNNEVKIYVTASDEHGVVVMYNNVDSTDNAQELTLVDGAAELTVDTEFNGNYYLWAVDPANNVTKVTVMVMIDKTPAVVTLKERSDAWTNTNVLIEGTVEDVGSDVEKVIYGSVDNPESEYNAEATLSEGTFSFELVENGTYYVWAKDNAGNYSEKTEIVVNNIDRQPPQVTNFNKNSNDATNKTVIFTVEAQDVGGSGIDKVVYSTENVYSYDLPAATLHAEEEIYTFTVSNNQEFNGTYYAWAIDNAGNVSEVAINSLQIDTTDPTVDDVTSNPNKVTNKSVVVTVAASDNEGGSGIEKVVYGTSAVYDEGMPTAEKKEDGSYVFTISDKQEYKGNYYIWAVDKAGNISAVKELAVWIELSKPTVTEVTANPDKATNQNIVVTAVVSDNENGSEIANVFYSPVAEYGTDAMKPADLDEDGNYTFTVYNDQEYHGNYYVWAVDNAGNISDVKEIPIWIDTTLPEVTIKVDGHQWENFLEAITFGIYHRNEIPVEITATDENGSGVSNVEYILASEPMDRDMLKASDQWVLYTGSFPIPAEDRYLIIYVHVQDAAGNEEYFSTDGIVIDTQGAQVFVEADFEKNFVNGVFFGDVDVKINVTDGEISSGIKHIEYWITVDNTVTKKETLYDFGYAGDYKDGVEWQILDTSLDEANRITKYDVIPTQDMLKKSWSDTITVIAAENNSSKVVVTVQVTDNAGITTTGETTLDIDITPPEITIVYNNGEGKQHNGQYYDAARTATITVKEREGHFVAPAVYVNETVEKVNEYNYIVITAKNAKGENVDFAKPSLQWTPTSDGYVAEIHYNVDAQYTFAIKNQDKGGKEATVITADETDAPYAFTVDTKNPTGTAGIAQHPWHAVVEALTFGIFSNTSLSVYADALDTTSPVKVEYYKVSGAAAAVRLSETALKSLAADQWTLVTEATEGVVSGAEVETVDETEQFVIYLKITDKANRVCFVSTDGAIVDKEAPSDENFIVIPAEVKQNTGNSNVYGYYTEDVPVDINIVDAAPSGIRNITYEVKTNDKTTHTEELYNFGYDGSYDATKEWTIKDGENVTTHKGIPTDGMLKRSWSGRITVKAAENNSSNVKVVVYVTDNAGNMTSKTIALDIDCTDPAIAVDYVNAGDLHNEKYYDNTRKATITITERADHFVEPQVFFSKEDVPEGATNYILITAEKANGEALGFAPEITWQHNIDQEDENKTTHVATVDYNVDANYTFEIANQDKAGRKNIGVTADVNDAPYDFVVDTESPAGTAIMATSAAETTWDAILEALTFGWYDSETIGVCVEAKDITSPVRIDYYKVTGKAAETVMTEDALRQVRWAWMPLVDDGNSVIEKTEVFTVDQEEQFAVYLRLTDYAGNTHFLGTGIAVVDQEAPASITFTEPEEQPENGIYKDDVEIHVNVLENCKELANGEKVYSGLKSVTYKIFNDSVSTEEPTQTGTLFTFEPGDIVKKEDLVTAFQTDANKFIPVDAELNNSNSVRVEVTAVDNADNSLTQTLMLKIDISAPAITVSYNGIAPDSGRYYNGTRIATIEIKERNFNPELVNFYITNTDGAIPVLPYVVDERTGEVLVNNWTRTDGQLQNGDDTTYTTTIEFHADGDYTFAMECTDLAGWTSGNVPDKDYGEKNAFAFAAGTLNPTDFTIDKTAPVVSVAYDNNSAQNGKYFKAIRTATVTIVEHNFPTDENDVKNRIVFTQTAARGGVVPEVEWTHNADTHIATFKYAVDGDYTFDVSARDLAGNASEAANYGNSVAAQDFIIDTTKNMISQEGVKNGHAYGYDATVIPNIKISDINLLDYKVTLVGVQKDQVIDLTEEVNKLIQEGTETVTGIFDIFVKEQNMDGIYTLTMTAKDKAGNEDILEIVFTVNRYGSVYVYSQYLMDLIANGGSYVYNVKEDLIITEYNADKLLSNSLEIEITIDGSPVENVLYTVTPEINDQVAVGSSGWYQYKYTISKDNFAADGIYKITVSSKDATGNSPANNNYEGMVMNFRVDSTPAEITNIVGLEEPIIDAQEVTVKYSVYDAIGLRKVTVYVNGSAVSEITDFTADANNYTGSFILTENSAAQTVRIVVEDMAGNTTDTSAEDFSSAYAFNSSVTVSTNIFVRWYANKGLFWGSIGGAAVVAGALWLIIANKKKKK